MDIPVKEFNKLNAYIPSLFEELKKDTAWSLNQEKLFIYILSLYYKHKKLIPKNNFTVDTIKNSDLNEINRNGYIDKESILNITGIPRSQFAREIRKITKGLKSSVATLPSKVEPGTTKSYIHRGWFEEFEYADDEGYLYFEIDRKVFPFLIVFCAYTRIQYAQILKFQNNYTFSTYIIFKLMLTKYKTSNELSISVDDFKNRLGIRSQYKTNYTMFKKAVVQKVMDEINSYTDLWVDFDEIKIGKKITSLNFSFSYKERSTEDEPIEDSPSTESETSLKQALTNAGINEKCQDKLLSVYTESEIKYALEKLESAISKGVCIKTVYGYILGILENNRSNVSSEDIKNYRKSTQNFTDNLSSKLSKFCDKHSDFIETLYQSSTKNALIHEDRNIELFDEFCHLIDQFGDTSSNEMMYITSDGKALSVNYLIMIRDIVRPTTQDQYIEQKASAISFL